MTATKIKNYSALKNARAAVKLATEKTATKVEEVQYETTDEGRFEPVLYITGDADEHLAGFRCEPADEEPEAEAAPEPTAPVNAGMLAPGSVEDMVSVRVNLSGNKPEDSDMEPVHYGIPAPAPAPAPVPAPAPMPTPAPVTPIPEPNTDGSNLSSRAILVKLQISGWAARKHDKEVSREVATNKGASEDAGRYVKRLLSKEAMTEVDGLSAEAREKHYALTMPWDEGAWRLLPISLYDEYSAVMDGYAEKRAAARQKLIDSYEEHIAKAKETLGAMFDRTEYPDVTGLINKISMSYEFQAVPDSKHFVADLPTAEAERIKSSMQEHIESRIKGTVIHLYRALNDVVQDLSYRMNETDDGKPRIFRDSLIDRLREAVRTVPELNLTGDAVLAQMCKSLTDALENVTPNNLRQRSKDFDAEKHNRMKEVADNLAERFNGYFGAPPARGEAKAAAAS